MYATCIHCHQPLGANESIEALPIGKRVAFDGEKGRLWVVCATCQRWNLTPFDARWEALEQCERAYRDTRVRLSTDNIGLARLRDGTDLVRIGKPQRPEFAAWRYGDQLNRRRKQQQRKVLALGGVILGGGLLGLGVAPLGASLGGLMPVLQVLNLANLLRMRSRMAKHLQKHAVLLEDGRRIAPAAGVRLIDMDVEERWGLSVGVLVPLKNTASEARKWDVLSQQYDLGTTTVRGRHAMPLLRKVLPGVNRGGATEAQIRDGVQLIEHIGEPAQFGAWAASQRRKWAETLTFGDTGDLQHIPVAARLAFEMAVNEDTERRALEGELAQLETAWREAEELASIADSLTPLQSIERRFNALRARVR